MTSTNNPIKTGFALKRRACEFCGKKRLCRANRITGWKYYCEPCHKHFDAYKKNGAVVKVRQPDPDYAGIARVCRQQVRLATRGMDPDGRVAAYLDEIPIKLSRRRLTWGQDSSTGRAGCYHADDHDGHSLGYVVVNVWICCTEERFAATLYHELAHAVNRWVNGPAADSHGPLWKKIMEQLGQPPVRCHNYRRSA